MFSFSKMLPFVSSSGETVMRLQELFVLAFAVFALTGCPPPPDPKQIDPEAKLVGKVMADGTHCEITTEDGHNACVEGHNHTETGNTGDMQTMAALAIGATAIGVAANGNGAAASGLIQAAMPLATTSQPEQTAAEGQCTWKGKSYGNRENVYFSSASEANDFWNSSGLSYGKNFAQRGAPSLSELNGKVMQTCQCGSGSDGGWGCI